MSKVAEFFKANPDKLSRFACARDENGVPTNIHNGVSFCMYGAMCKFYEGEEFRNRLYIVHTRIREPLTKWSDEHSVEEIVALCEGLGV